jgi:hypothetical protein
MAPLTARERQAKQALAVDPAHRLNIYTCAPGRSLLGWAYLPFFGNENQTLHGVVVHYGSLPSGWISGYDRGTTLVHEVGHYLGLLHTFENGCSAPGDFIEDTPSEASPAIGMSVARNTCPDVGEDPVHNYMDTAMDAGMSEFTAGQAERMNAIVAVYRPSLLDAPALPGREALVDASSLADQTRAIEFRGAFPNPFRTETAIRFTLPRSEHVSLRIYSLAGQLVRTLMDAQLPAGAHSALFSGRDLPSGTYYLALRVGKALMTRSAVLVR